MRVVVIGETDRNLAEISDLLKTGEASDEDESSASQWAGEISNARILDDDDPDFVSKLTDANPNVAIILLDSEKSYVRKSKSLVRKIRNKIPGIIVIGLVNQVQSDESLAIEKVESILGVTCYEFPKNGE